MPAASRRPWASRSAQIGIVFALLVIPAAGTRAGPAPVNGSTISTERLERRHGFGLQIGGSGFLQLVYRYRAAGPLHLELGALGAPHGLANMSLGVVVGSPVGTRLFPYAGLGGALAGVASESGPGCPSSGSCLRSDEVLRFFFARFGVGVAFGAERRHLVGLEVGAWLGLHTDTERRGFTTVTRRSERFLWPTAGLAYLFAF